MHRTATILLLSVATLVACEKESESGPAPTSPTPSADITPATTAPDATPTSAPAAAPTPTTISLPGVTLSAPAPWVSRPGRGMRAAQFTLAADDHEDVELVVYDFGPGQGGPVQENLDRWCAQIQQPDGSDSAEAATVDKREVNGLTVTTLAVQGAYVAETFPGSGIRVNKPDSSLRAAIIEAPGRNYYIKMVGPTATIDHWSDSYEAFLASATPPPAS